MCQLCSIAAKFATYSPRQASLVFDLSQFAATVEANDRLLRQSTAQFRHRFLGLRYAVDDAIARNPSPTSDGFGTL